MIYGTLEQRMGIFGHHMRNLADLSSCDSPSTWFSGRRLKRLADIFGLEPAERHDHEFVTTFTWRWSSPLLPSMVSCTNVDCLLRMSSSSARTEMRYAPAGQHTQCNQCVKCTNLFAS